MFIHINTTELDQTTTRAVELCVRYRELVKDMRGFLGSQSSEIGDHYLIDQVREKASNGLLIEAGKAMRREQETKSS